MTKSSGLPFDLMTLWFQTPLVIAARMSPLASLSSGSVQSQAETTRMVSEKMAAATESMMAMQFSLAREMMKRPMIFGSRASSDAANRVFASGVKPYSKRVRANAKRLGR